jgi:hypothetical protein
MLGDRLLDASCSALPHLLSPSLAEVDDFEILWNPVVRRSSLNGRLQSRLEQGFSLDPWHRRVVFSVHKHYLKAWACTWNVGQYVLA